jgi:hypothetical protein
LTDPAFDHLVVAAQSLADGCEFVATRLGVRPVQGGKHTAMGTHNALASLGPHAFLEVIAIDPDGTPPARPRWFDLDEPRMRASLAEGPRLVHWVARTSAIDVAKARARVDPGTVHPMARGDFQWRITIPDDGHLPGAGLLPTLIQWVALAGEHPEPAPIRAALAVFGFSDLLKVTYGRYARLAAMLRTSRGLVTI